MRVVADTNIYVSAVLFGGAAEEFLGLLRQKQFTLVVSQDLVNELRGVLREKFGWGTRIRFT